jgi:hypothetical protein
MITVPFHLLDVSTINAMVSAAYRFEATLVADPNLLTDQELFDVYAAYLGMAV